MPGNFNLRLVLAFIVSLLDEVVVVALILWVLPRMGVEVSPPTLAIILVLLGVYAVVSFRLVMRALTKKPVVGLPDMAGARGRAVTALSPEGTVRIRGETWQAVSTGGYLQPGDEVIVVSQSGLKLAVRRAEHEPD